MNTQKKILVSIVIPCYNAEKFISETIYSIFKQSHQNFEIIVVNDGSTDRTEDVINKFNDPRIIYFKKNNTGVSDSRNKGFQISKGEFILFLDSDDILADDFIEKRLIFLLRNTNLGFCSSYVIKIDKKGNKISDKTLRGVASDVLQEILTYNSEIITCPSNYLFRKDLLKKHNLIFRTSLSSSADRYFLIEISKYAKGGIISDGGILYYRVHNSSMSNNLTIDLIKDNILFQQKILKLNIPKKLRREFCFKTNYIFAGSYFKLKKMSFCMWYSCRAFYYSPIRFLKQISQ